MKDRTIIFSGPMVRAILEGRKTQTRRLVKPQDWQLKSGEFRWIHPYGRVGDRLWVRETWAGNKTRVAYRATMNHAGVNWDAEHTKMYWERLQHPTLPVPIADKWKPSIHMPRWASRLTLEITGVRIQRLQDISEDDAIAEGIRCGGESEWTGTHKSGDCHRGRFAFLWDSLNLHRGPWVTNPWVWAITFRRDCVS